MKTYWHPLLTRVIQQSYGDRLQIQEAIKLSTLPLEIDLLIKPKVVVETLPEPFNYLGDITIVEYKGPRDTVGWETVTQIEIYACLYQREQNFRERSKLTLWLIGSQCVSDFNQPPIDYIDQLSQIGPGIQRGLLSKFPLFVINLAELFLNEDTFPLLLMFQGDSQREKAREREVIEFFLNHLSQFRDYLDIVTISHTQMLEEVLAMRKINVDGLEIDIPALVRLFGWKRLMQGVSADEIVQNIEREELLSKLYPDIPPAEIERLVERYKKLNNKS